MPDGLDRPQRVSDVPWAHLMTPLFHELPQVEPFMAAGLRRDALERFTSQDVLQQILLGRLRLWVSYDREPRKFEMGTVTEVIQSP
jgi:hypothetical protein